MWINEKGSWLQGKQNDADDGDEVSVLCPLREQHRENREVLGK